MIMVELKYVDRVGGYWQVELENTGRVGQDTGSIEGYWYADFEDTSRVG